MSGIPECTACCHCPMFCFFGSLCFIIYQALIGRMIQPAKEVRLYSCYSSDVDWNLLNLFKPLMNRYRGSTSLRVPAASKHCLARRHRGWQSSTVQTTGEYTRLDERCFWLTWLNCNEPTKMVSAIMNQMKS